jgi:amidase
VLHGLPLAIKDTIDTAGIPTTFGSPIHADRIPAYDAACVSIARSAGAFVLGKTSCSEFASSAPTATRNPVNTFHTPGGSSAGSAAAVAAGMTPVALGTQTAGSVIRPASYCGVVGYKPSPRLIPRMGVRIISDTLDEVGVFARSVEDAGLVGGVLALQHPNPLPSALAFPPLVGVVMMSRSGEIATSMAEAVNSAASALSTAGARVASAAWPAAFDALFDAHRTIQWFETLRNLEWEFTHHRRSLSAQLVADLTMARSIDGGRYARAIETARNSFAAIESVFAGRDVLIAPAAPGEAPASLTTTGDPLFNRPWQLLRCPCITIPCARGVNDLPLGLQIIARPGDDLRLLAAASWIEAALARRSDGSAS